MKQIIKIQLPTRPQVDTILTLFIINEFGKEEFGDIFNTEILINPLLEAGETYQTKLEKGTLCIDVGGGPFDHHGADSGSASKAAKYFNQENNPSLRKLLELAERSEKGKGTISQDPLDKAFGFDGTVMTLNKVHQNSPWRVIEALFPIIEAHYKEAHKRSVEYPELFTTLKKEGKAEEMVIKLNGKTWKSCIVHTSDSGFISYLRAYSGGKFEIVAQVLPTGHTNILTRMNNGVDLSRLAYLLRRSELVMAGSNLTPDTDKLYMPGRIEEVPQWYYDTVTNSILNGGIHPATVISTKVGPEPLYKLLLKWQEIA